MFFTICYTNGHLHVGTHKENRSTANDAMIIKKINQWTKSQTEILEKTFQTTAYPERKEIDQLANSFNVRSKKIENWFGNKRCNLANKGMFHQSE